MATAAQPAVAVGRTRRSLRSLSRPPLNASIVRPTVIAMSWRALIDEAYAALGDDVRLRYEQPAGPELLRRVERALSCSLPEELTGLLSETNGVMELMSDGGEWIETGWLIWSADELRDRNIDLRRRRGSDRFPSGALAFADAGSDGIVFAVDIRSGSSEVFAWEPLECQRIVKARSVREFLVEWIGGRVSV